MTFESVLRKEGFKPSSPSSLYYNDQIGIFIKYADGYNPYIVIKSNMGVNLRGVEFATPEQMGAFIVKSKQQLVTKILNT